MIAWCVEQAGRWSGTLSDAVINRPNSGLQSLRTMKPLTRSTGRITTVADGALATVLGARPRWASSYKLDVGGEVFDLDLEERGSNHGRSHT